MGGRKTSFSSQQAAHYCYYIGTTIQLRYDERDFNVTRNCVFLQTGGGGWSISTCLLGGWEKGYSDLTGGVIDYEPKLSRLSRLWSRVVTTARLSLKLRQSREGERIGCEEMTGRYFSREGSRNLFPVWITLCALCQPTSTNLQWNFMRK